MADLKAGMVADAINELDPKFDTHDVEKRLMRNHAVATAGWILRHAKSRDVLRTFSQRVRR